MAIDTREKRQAVAALSGKPYFGPGVTSNASPDQEWRQEVGWGYPGILAASPSPVTDVNQELIQDFYVSLARMMNH